MNSSRLIALAVAISVCTILTGCPDGNDSSIYDPVPIEPEEKEAPEEPEDPEEGVEAIAGEQISGVDTRYEIRGGGAAGAPDLANPRSAWTAQEAANALVESGISYDDGFSHNVEYARCTGRSDDLVTGIRYGSFECYVESFEVAPYYLELIVQQGGTRATVMFVDYA